MTFSIRNIAVSLLILVSGMMPACYKDKTTTAEFLKWADACIPSNLLGSGGSVVFLGPNIYQPGDLFTRGVRADNTPVFDPRYEYKALVGEDVAKNIVALSDIPAVCELTSNKSFSFGGDISAAFSAAATPATATAAGAFKSSSVTAVGAKKVYISAIPYFEKYTDTIRNLAPGNSALLAIKNGGYFVASAIIVIEDYSVDVQFGPDFNANAAVEGKLGPADVANLKAGVTVAAKDERTLHYTISGKTSVGIIARSLGADLQVLSASNGTDQQPYSNAVAGVLTRRDEYKQ